MNNYLSIMNNTGYVKSEIEGTGPSNGSLDTGPVTASNTEINDSGKSSDVRAKKSSAASFRKLVGDSMNVGGKFGDNLKGNHRGETKEKRITGKLAGNKLDIRGKETQMTADEEELDTERKSSKSIPWRLNKRKADEGISANTAASKDQSTDTTAQSAASTAQSAASTVQSADTAAQSAASTAQSAASTAQSADTAAQSADAAGNKDNNSKTLMARFPNVNLLLQRYANKRTTAATTTTTTEQQQQHQQQNKSELLNIEKNNEDDKESLKPATKAANWFDKMTNINVKRRFENGHTKSAENGADAGASGEETSTMCGGFGWYPSCMQRFATPPFFLAAFCFQNVFQGAALTVLLGSATSIEKHFHFSSADLGSIFTFGEIGPIFLSVTLSYFGGMGNRPRWMAIGQALSGMGLLLAYANYLFYPPTDISELSNPEGSQKLCSYRDLITELIVPLSPDFSSPLTAASLRSLEKPAEICFATNWAVFFSWLVVYTCITVGNSIVYTVGAPYLDDSISKKDSPLYFAISITVRILGPLLGFSTTAAFMKIYVNPLSNPGLTPADPRWIGAWWIGCLLVGFSFLIVASVTATFPRKMAKKLTEQDPENLAQTTDSDKELTIHNAKDDQRTTNCNNGQHQDIEKYQIGNGQHQDIVKYKSDSVTETDAEDQERNNENGKVVEHFDGNSSGVTKDLSYRENITLLLLTIKRLLRNPVVLSSMTADFFSLSGVLAVFTFLPKYLEHQFRVDKSTAVFFTGISGSSSVIFGVLGGGYFIKRCRPTARTITFITMMCKLAYIPTLLVLMNINCGFGDDLPGVSSMDGSSLDLYRGCSGGCDCSQREFIPVCVTDGNLQLSFFSPCHAGCYVPETSSLSTSSAARLRPLATYEDNDVNEFEDSFGGSGMEIPELAGLDLEDQENVVYYKNCSCGSPSAVVRSGYCKSTCSGFFYFVAVQITVTGFLGFGTIGAVLISLRCVPEEDKAPHLGLRSSMVSIAMLLNPVLVGSLTDSACLVWEKACDVTGACWVYGVENLSRKLFVTSIVLMTVSVILEYCLFRSVKHVKLFDDDLPTSSTSIRKTLYSIYRRITSKKGSSEDLPEQPQRKPDEESSEEKVSQSQSRYSLLTTFRKLSKSSPIVEKIWPNQKSRGNSKKAEKKMAAARLQSGTAVPRALQRGEHCEYGVNDFHDINLDDRLRDVRENESKMADENGRINYAIENESKMADENGRTNYAIENESKMADEIGRINYAVDISSENIRNCKDICVDVISDINGSAAGTHNAQEQKKDYDQIRARLSKRN